MDIFEPLSREEIEQISWEHFNTTVERGEVFFRPVDLSETLFVLQRLGIAVQLTAPTFLIVLGAVALAAAIAFGFGAQGVARDIVEKAYERRDEEARQKIQQGDSGPAATAETPSFRREV